MMRIMNPLYHVAAGSFLANAKDFNLRERKLIMFAALSTDVDFLPSMVNPDLETLHHTFSHNIFWALGIGVILSLINRGRYLTMFLFCAVSSFVQVILDNLTNDVSWKIMYFWPAWKMDFALGNYIGWEYINVFIKYGVQGVFMAAILAGVVYLYLRKGRTFIELASWRLDRLLTDFIAAGFSGRRCAVCGARAFFRDSEDEEYLCGRHVRILRNFSVEKKPGTGSEDEQGKGKEPRGP